MPIYTNPRYSGGSYPASRDGRAIAWVHWALFAVNHCLLVTDFVWFGGSMGVEDLHCLDDPSTMAGSPDEV